MSSPRNARHSAPQLAPFHAILRHPISNFTISGTLLHAIHPPSPPPQTGANESEATTTWTLRNGGHLGEANRNLFKNQQSEVQNSTERDLETK